MSDSARAAPRLLTGARDVPAITGRHHPTMVQDEDIRRLREMRRERRARLEALKTPADVRRYQERAQAAIDRAFAPRPRKTPLNARVIGVTEGRHARIEKVLFESRPNFFVTANLYLPQSCSARRPACGVIADCGHSQNGKQYTNYQAFPQRLAANGFMTLLIDPINQGERNQYHGLPTDQQKGLSDSCCDAHNMLGKQQELVGEFFGMWRAWDNIRALDYLLTRPELDPTHLGMTGNSGGGTMTTWTWSIEHRLTMAAPSCFVTTFLHNLENELPADCEQYPPGVLGAGLEMADFLIVQAPKPVVILAQNLDFFDRRGAEEACADVRRVYGLLGAAKNAEIFMGPTPHGYSWHAQEKMTAFFCRQTGRPHRAVKVDDIEDNGDKLLVTPKGNVIAAGSTPLFELTARAGRELAARRRLLSLKALQRQVRTGLNLDARAGTFAGEKAPPPYRVLRPHQYAAYRAARYAVETESTDRDTAISGIRAFLHQPMPTLGFTLDAVKHVTLYLPHLSVEAELSDSKLGGKYMRREGFFALDVRGLGESLAGRAPEDHFFAAYQFDYMHHGHGLLFGRSYFGRRVFDVLRTIDLLVNAGAKTFDLVGRGHGALHAAYAAVLSPRVKRVTLINAPLSYLEWTSSPVVRWPASMHPHGVLKHFDLPDLYRALKGRLELIDPWDAQMRPARGYRGASKRISRGASKISAQVASR